eukprot:1293757-Heterocapsa_arctica.AAC.1
MSSAWGHRVAPPGDYGQGGAAGEALQLIPFIIFIPTLPKTRRPLEVHLSGCEPRDGGVVGTGVHTYPMPT